MQANNEFHAIDRHSRQGDGLFSLRKRSNEHPLGMFAVFVGAAFAAMVLVPVSGTAFASFGNAPVRAAVAAPVEETRSTPKTDRAPISETDIACRGQAWGAESEGCLSVIEKQSGKSEARKIRVIANAAEPNAAPNIF